jgi:CDP-diacylglycerol--serine O-phosphatidyltransferase
VEASGHESGYFLAPAGRTFRNPAGSSVRKIHLLPNLLTLGNSFCGLLAIAKGIDALSFSQADPGIFFTKMESACWLIFVGMLFDALDGKVARMVGGSSAFGAQLDSFSDMLSFGVAPALLAKILIEHEGARLGYSVHLRLDFGAAAVFAIMAILRLARFNLENEPDESAHQYFKGLPSPGAAGALVATMLMYLALNDPRPEGLIGELQQQFPWIVQKPFLYWFMPTLAWMLPLLGLLMVSRVRYVHTTSFLSGRSQFVTLVVLVVGGFCFYIEHVVALFLVFNVYVILGLVLALRRRPVPERAA